MLYIISGASRSGKSILSRMLLKKYGFPYFSLDALYAAYQKVYPDSGLEKAPVDDFTRGNILWPMTHAICENLLSDGEAYVIEGLFISPAQIHSLITENPGQVRACCIGYKDIDIEKKLHTIKNFAGMPNDWLSTSDDSFIRHVIQVSKRMSLLFFEECQRYNIPYFDTSEDFENILALCEQTLLQKPL